MKFKFQAGIEYICFGLTTKELKNSTEIFDVHISQSFEAIRSCDMSKRISWMGISHNHFDGSERQTH